MMLSSGLAAADSLPQVEVMSAAKKGGLIGQDASRLDHRLKGDQRCAEDVQEGESHKEMLLPQFWLCVVQDVPRTLCCTKSCTAF